MLYGPDGQHTTVVDGKIRRGMQADATKLPKGAMVSPAITRRIQNQIRNNPDLMARLEAADKMTGTKCLHLDMAKRGGMNNQVQKSFLENQAFAERVTENKQTIVKSNRS